MTRAERILDLLPTVLATGGSGGLLRHVVQALSVALEEADATLIQIQRAHRLNDADRIEDLVRLAAIIDLPSPAFSDLTTTAGPLDYASRLERLRHRVRRLAALHIRGLASPPAILDYAAALLDAEPVPRTSDGAIYRRVDPSGWVTRVAVRLADDPGRGDAALILEESPVRERRQDPVPLRPGESWTAEAGPASAQGVRIAITGMGDRTVRPSICCTMTGEGIAYDGVLESGETLIFEDGRARIEGRDVDNQLVRFRAALADISTVGASVSDERPRVFGLTDYVPPARPVELPAGASTWVARVEEGVVNSAQADFAVFDQPRDPVGKWDEAVADAAVYDIAPSLVAGMRWLERVSCAFKLTLPRARPPEELVTAEVPVGPAAISARDSVDLANADGAAPGGAASVVPPKPQLYADRVAPLLGRVRAAGVRAFVATAPEAWILDETRLEALDAGEGPGVTWAYAQLNRLGENPLVHIGPQ